MRFREIMGFECWRKHRRIDGIYARINTTSKRSTNKTIKKSLPNDNNDGDTKPFMLFILS